jgi:flagellar biogenesis protein FliO
MKKCYRVGLRAAYLIRQNGLLCEVVESTLVVGELTSKVRPLGKFETTTRMLILKARQY